MKIQEKILKNDILPQKNIYQDYFIDQNTTKDYTTVKNVIVHLDKKKNYKKYTYHYV